MTGNIAVATFEHDVSRKVDPQLHTHCVLMTFTKRFDGTWRSIYQDGFFYDSKKFGVIYQNALARQVVSLGYEIHTYSNGTFDIKGYTKEQINAFSKRTAQLLEMGAITQKEKTQIINKNRTKKVSISKESLREKWKLEAKHLGIVHPVRMMRKNIADKKSDHFNRACSQILKRS